MPTIRVLIVDDAVMVRSRLSKVLATDPAIEIAGVAATGQIALAKLAQLNPDVVILDMEMPDMDGLQILAHIRQNNTHLPVIMFSSMTTRGATVTLDALTLGASDYVTKPSHLGNVDDVTQYLKDTLISKIKALSRKATHKAETSPLTSVPLRQFNRPKEMVEIVAIGVSTGGPNALGTLLADVPPDFPVPIAIVQHMPPMFTRLLAERLTTKCALPVREAIAGATLSPGTIWIAPGDYHLTVKQVNSVVQLATEQTPPKNSCRPSVDVLFESVAQVYGDRTLGVILTGMGQDGLRGCEQIRDRNGQILAQDEDSSVVWGMPGFVANAGLADAVLPLDQIMPEILRRVSRASFVGG
ncbi:MULTISPECIES: chemotaxis response regulator protein-glutamate methylesterase [unclassified Leptolyngbya]|uniref:protein-glutamate methylesterase/protein-glutamine glutaminase n=1 Tax=unclassified Leptolyngbya TaxID=2650499 RepID=UPI00168650D8|nr:MULTISPECIES: chemotaxis response regulator protein-glutamate methylesterase [unclassified Leptolyngbya]MBD1913810.1 chemotaxis response regulator protein-glutamate methylesterase [Leptolyngbya sp. FACHB-8]MBD2156551.1 chemotaxis response regulator protein-glutamate methylesterase [Leptolyngbya sp. FACHB-16]